MTGFINSLSPCGCQGNRAVLVPSHTGFAGLGRASHTEPAIIADRLSFRGLGDLTTLGTDLANGDIAAVFSDLLPYFLGAGALYLVYRYVIKGGGGDSGRRRRLSRAREMAAYEIAKAKVGA